MFSISTEEVKVCIHEAVAAEQNIMTLVRGILVAVSWYASIWLVAYEDRKRIHAVRFVQVTRGNTHAFKKRYFRIMIRLFCLKEGLVEISFLFPTQNMEAVAISEVTSEGQLASFRANQESQITWIKSKEISMVQIVLMM